MNRDNIEAWYDDLRKEVKENKVCYSEFNKRRFVDGGICKIPLNKLIALSGVKIELNKNVEENKFKIHTGRKNSKAYMYSIAHILFGKNNNYKSDKIGISLQNFEKIKNNKRDIAILLFHEIAHGLLHRKRFIDCNYRDEIEAQSVAYIIGKYLRLEESVSPSMINFIMNKSRKYHRYHQSEGKEKPIRKRVIINTSKKIIECLEQNKIIYKEFFKI